MGEMSDFVVKIFVEDFLLRVCSRLFRLTVKTYYMYVCTYVHTYIHTYIYIFTYLHVQTHVLSHLCKASTNVKYFLCNLDAISVLTFS